MNTIRDFVTICATILTCKVSPEANPEPVGMIHHSLTSSQPQNPESLLTSIDERLRLLDNLHGLRFAAEMNGIEAQNRKLEALETKLTRIENVLELRVDKLTESLSSKILKEELGKEQLSRRIDVIYERLNHRMSYMESRIEKSIEKFQNAVDATLARITGQLEHLVKTSSDLENDIIEVGAAVDEGKNVMQILNNSFHANQNLRKMFDNQTTIQFLTSCQDTMMTYSREIQKVVGKNLDLANATRLELQEAISAINLSVTRRPHCPNYSDASMDYLIDKVNSMAQKNEGNYQKLDTTIERLHMRQELYQESCHRLQLKEPQIENRIVEILDKILDSLENRTFSMDNNYDKILEQLKSHHTYIIRAVGQTTNSVIRLNEQMTHDVKSLHLTPPGSDRIDQIIINLQELQSQFQDLNTSLKNAERLTSNQSRYLLNNTTLILNKMQELNENMTIIVERLFEIYKGLSEPEMAIPIDDASSRILQIFNMTDIELTNLDRKINNKNATSLTKNDSSLIGFENTTDYDEVED